jgi:hypothetical protein
LFGSSVGLAVGVATGNPFLAGAAGGLASNVVEQSLGDNPIEVIPAVASTLGGGIGGSVATKILPTRGRTPSLLTPRDDFGKNSYRIMGREATSASIEGAVGAVVGGITNAVRPSSGCGCK